MQNLLLPAVLLFAQQACSTHAFAGTAASAFAPSAPRIQNPIAPLVVNTDGITSSTTLDGAPRPAISVYKVQKGTTGNNREDGSDLDDIDVTLSHRSLADVGIDIDSIDHLGQGLYEVRYTPTISGHYDTAIKIEGKSISTDLSAGLIVQPARADAIQSTHTASPLATEGVKEKFTIQAIDRFGNELLSSPLEDEFLVDIHETPHKCSGRTDLESTLQPLHVDLEYDDIADDSRGGLYRASYLPSLAGTHHVSLKLRSSGGLLGTYYKNIDFTQAVLGNSDHLLYIPPYLKEPWCQPEVIECDSTRLDSDLTFDWGFGSPLASDQEDFPIDSFSVRWIGELKAPSTDEYKFVITLNGMARLVIGETPVIDTISTPSQSKTVAGTMELEADVLYPVIIEYVHSIDEALFQLQWSSWSMKEQPIPSSALYYIRHIGNGANRGPPSPFPVEIIPGAIDSTSSATGDVLDSCVATTECSFVIQTKDSAGNNRYNDGTDPSFEISIVGKDGWAGQGRVNDDLTYSSEPLSVSTTIASQDWQFLGSVEVVQGSSEITTSTNLLSYLARGDAIVLAGQTYIISSDGTFDASTIPLNKAVIGPSMSSVALYKASPSCSTGTHLVIYTPRVRGRYEVNVKLPPVLEVQRIETVVSSDSTLSGTFTLTFRSPDGIVHTTGNIAYDVNGAELNEALEQGLPNVGEVTVSANPCVDGDAANGCSWDITFAGVGAIGSNVHMLIPSWENLEGDAASIVVTELQPGVAAKVIDGFPRTIDVAPDEIDPTWTTAHGQGLVTATAGMEAEFTIQAKDGAGNDQLSSVNDVELFTVKIIPEGEEVGEVDTAGIVGSVAAEDDGRYKVRYTPERSGYHTINVAYQTMTADVELVPISKSPFRVLVSPAKLSAAHSVASDSPGVANHEGLSKGVYKSNTQFSIQLRDEFHNKVSEGPQSEIQIIEMWSLSPLGGTFDVGYDDAKVTLPAGAGIAQVEKAIQSLPGLGAATVTSNAAKDVVADRTLAVTTGLDTIVPSDRLDSDFQVGDWIRIGDQNDGPVFTIIAMSTVTPFTVTLSSAYLDESNAAATIYGQALSGALYGFQYIVSFEATLGDIEPLSVDGTALEGDETNIYITSCNRNVHQTIETRSNPGDNVDSNTITGTFYLSYKGERTPDLPATIDSNDLKAAIEGSFHPSVRQVTVVSEVDLDNGAKRWDLRLDSFEGEVPDLLFAEGHLLLAGRPLMTEPPVAVTAECPAASSGVPLLEAKSRAGRRGQEFVVDLTGPEEVQGHVTYVADGLYAASYLSPRVGEYRMNVKTAVVGGLRGQYYNNRWLYGSPIEERIDDKIDFVWTDMDPISKSGNDFISVRWTGFIKPAYSEIYTFRIRVNDGARLWVDGSLIIDEFDSLVDEDEGEFDDYEGSTSLPLEAGRLTSIKLEYQESRGEATLRLEWKQGGRKPFSVIDSHRLYYAGNHVDASPYTVQTQAIVPTEPRNCSLTVIGAQRLETSWIHPTDDGGEEVLSFKIVVEDVEMGAIVSDDEVLVQDIYFDDDASIYSRHVNGLVAGQQYGVRVSAGNSAGNGEYCPNAYATPMSEPMAVSSVELERHPLSPTTLLLSFNAVTDEQNNGSEVDSYAIEWSIDALFATKNVTRVEVDLDSLTSDGQFLNYEIEGLLEPGQAYHVRVVARNVVGYGPPSSAAILSPGSKPGPVDSLFLDVIHHDGSVSIGESSTSLLLSWTKPTQDNGFRIESYLIEYWVPGSDRVQEIHVNEDQLKYTLTNLTPGQPYAARISARNILGLSPPTSSVPDELAPPLLPPSEPTKVALSRSGTSLRVSWENPHSDGGDPITQYLVEYDPRDRFDSRDGAPLGFYNYIEPLECNPCEHTILGLAEGTPFYVRVFAGNSNGYSDPVPSLPLSMAPISPPSPPFVLHIELSSENGIDLSFPPSLDAAGGNVTEYRIEWNAVDLYQPHTVQRIIIDDADGGTFQLEFQGHRTRSLRADCSAHQMKVALQMLPTIGSVEVAREVITNGYAWLATFPGFMNMNAISVVSSLTGTNPTAGVTIPVKAYDGFEIQSITCESCLHKLSSSFRLAYNGNATQNIQANASPSELKEALQDIGLGGVKTSRRTDKGLSGYEWRVTFLSELGDLPLLSPIYNTQDIRTMYVNEISKGVLPRMDGDSFGSQVINVTEEDFGGWITQKVQAQRGRPFHFQISAANEAGYGRSIYSTPPTVTIQRRP